MRAHFRKIVRLPRQMLWAFVMESVETKRMLATFARQGRGRLLTSSRGHKPTDEEIQAAMEQLRDLPRLLPFFVLVIAPVPGVTEGYTLVAITLEKWLGHKVSLLPSQFRQVFTKHAKPAEPEAAEGDDDVRA
jgi:hypothetical protein